MKKNSIVINNFTFAGKRISSVKALLWTSVSKNELPIDTLTARIAYSGNYQLMSADPYLLESSDGFRLFASDSDWDIDGFDIAQCQYGDEVACYHQDALIGKFFFEKYKRVSTAAYDISCISAIGLLDNTIHYGGIYTGQTTKWVLDDIIAGQIPYLIDTSIEDSPVYGWLPIETRRENLHQLLFAQGISVSHNADGIVQFHPLTASTRKTIPESRTFYGGTVDYQAHITRASVIEHSYIKYADDKQTTLFEGTVKADPIQTPKGLYVNGAIIEFQAPMHSLSVTGSQIIESGVNYAVLSTGSATLKGKEYTHTQRTVQAGNQTQRSIVERKDNEVTVSSATLVNVTNSESVAARLMAYYGAVDIATQDIVVDGERPGDAVSFTDAFGDSSEGFIETIEIAMSKIMRGATTIAKNYVPPIVVNYTHYAIITADQIFTVPEGAIKIGIVLIGGAQGGKSGQKGSDAQPIQVSFTGGLATAQYAGYGLGMGGDGGFGGVGGKGGNILQTSLRVTAGQEFPIHIGRGGDGAPYSPTLLNGAQGSETMFGELSSAIGASFDRGYLEPFTNEIYGMAGMQGISGGDGAGGKHSAGSVDGTNAADFVSGNSITDEDGNVYRCGLTPSDTLGKVIVNAKRVVGSNDGDLLKGFAGSSASGSLGGGAAAGSNGADGSGTGTANGSKSGTTLHVYSAGEPGTLGATASKIPKKAARGCGGRGGYGGGGAGAPGLSISSKRYGSAVTTINATSVKPADGLGGNGGTGGTGADGVAIIYW